MQDLFLKIISKEIPSYIVYEDEKTIAFLDINPITKGHVLVVPKNYSRNLLDISEDDLCSAIKTVKYLSPIVMKAVKAEGFCIEQNNETVAGQVIMHTHFHIIPRFKNDGLVHWPSRPTTKEYFRDIQEKIKEIISK